MVKSSISLNKHWSFERFIHFIYVKYHAEALSSLFSGFLYDSFGLWFLLIYKRKLTCPFLEILWVSRVYGEVMECSDKLRYRQDVTMLGCDIQLFPFVSLKSLWSKSGTFILSQDSFIPILSFQHCQLSVHWKH